ADLLGLNGEYPGWGGRLGGGRPAMTSLNGCWFRAPLHDGQVWIEVAVRLNDVDALANVRDVAGGQGGVQCLLRLVDQAQVDARPDRRLLQVRIHPRKRSRHQSLSLIAARRSGSPLPDP